MCNNKQKFIRNARFGNQSNLTMPLDRIYATSHVVQHANRGNGDVYGFANNPTDRVSASPRHPPRIVIRNGTIMLIRDAEEEASPAPREPNINSGSQDPRPRPRSSFVEGGITVQINSAEQEGYPTPREIYLYSLWRDPRRPWIFM